MVEEDLLMVEEPDRGCGSSATASITARRSVLSFLAVVLLCGQACGSTPRDVDPPPGALRASMYTEAARTASTHSLRGVKVHLTRLAGIGTPITAIAGLPDRDALLLGTRDGRVIAMRYRRNGDYLVPSIDTTPLLDLSDRVSTDGERGLLSLALIDEGRQLLLVYTALDGAITLAALRIAADGSPIGDVRSVLSISHPFSGHNGGDLAVLPEGGVLLSLGDMDLKWKTPPSAQDSSELLGSIIRVPESAFALGASMHVPTARDIVAKGLRNPWRMSFDVESGKLWIGDVGEDAVEELNQIAVVERSETVNFGWPYYEGSRVFRTPAPPAFNFESPILERPHDAQTCAIIPGDVYRGRSIPILVGAFIYADMCGTAIRGLIVGGARASGGQRDVDDRSIAEVPAGAVSFGTDRRGELYLTNLAGEVYRADPDDEVPDVRGDTVLGVARVTTTTSAVPVELCDLRQALGDLADFAQLDPSAMEERIRGAQESLFLAVGSTSGALHDDLVQLASLLDLAFRSIKAHSFDRNDPAIAGFERDALEGRGAFEAFPGTLGRVLSATERC